MCDLHDSISSFYMINNMYSISGLTYFYVYLIYSSYVYFNQPSLDLLDFLLTDLLWGLYYTPCCLWMIIFSSWIESEGEKTVALVHQLASKDGKLDVLKSSYIMALQAQHRQLKISSLFDVNWKTLFALLGTIFSYSIVLIQFHEVLSN